jgi:hypothetical protein
MNIWPFYRQVQLADVEPPAGWELDGPPYPTIKVWADPAHPEKYTTYWCGDQGLAMLWANGLMPNQHGVKP